MEENILKKISQEDIDSIFTAIKTKKYSTSDKAVCDFVKSGEIIMEVNWEYIADDFNLAKRRISGSISKIKFSPYDYGLVEEKLYKEKFNEFGKFDNPFNPLNDVGVKSISKESRLFLVHKESSEFKSRIG